MNKFVFATSSLFLGATLTQAAVISVVETGTLEPERSIVENGGAGVFDGEGARGDAGAARRAAVAAVTRERARR